MCVSPNEPLIWNDIVGFLREPKFVLAHFDKQRHDQREAVARRRDQERVLKQRQGALSGEIQSWLDLFPKAARGETTGITIDDVDQRIAQLRATSSRRSKKTSRVWLTGHSVSTNKSLNATPSPSSSIGSPVDSTARPRPRNTRLSTNSCKPSPCTPSATRPDGPSTTTTSAPGPTARFGTRTACRTSVFIWFYAFEDQDSPANKDSQTSPVARVAYPANCRARTFCLTPLEPGSFSETETSAFTLSERSTLSFSASSAPYAAEELMSAAHAHRFIFAISRCSTRTGNGSSTGAMRATSTRSPNTAARRIRPRTPRARHRSTWRSTQSG